MSNLNCKEGDRAKIVSSAFGHEGMVVTCLKMIGSDVTVTIGDSLALLRGGPWWLTDTELEVSSTTGRRHFSPYRKDSNLRPTDDIFEVQP